MRAQTHALTSRTGRDSECELVVFRFARAICRSRARSLCHDSATGSSASGSARASEPASRDCEPPNNGNAAPHPSSPAIALQPSVVRACAPQNLSSDGAKLEGKREREREKCNRRLQSEEARSHDSLAFVYSKLGSLACSLAAARSCACAEDERASPALLFRSRHKRELPTRSAVCC